MWADALVHSREARLGVSAGNAAALRLYERVGMRARFRVDGCERPAAESGRALA